MHLKRTVTISDLKSSEVSTVDSLEDLINNFEPETTTTTVQTSKSTPPPSKRKLRNLADLFLVGYIEYETFGRSVLIQR